MEASISCTRLSPFLGFYATVRRREPKRLGRVQALTHLLFERTVQTPVLEQARDGESCHRVWPIRCCLLTGCPRGDIPDEPIRRALADVSAQRVGHSHGTSRAEEERLRV